MKAVLARRRSPIDELPIELFKRVEPTGRESLDQRATFKGGTLVLSSVFIGAMAGILLGLRFKVFVLIPATLIAACTIIAMGHGFKAIVLTTLTTAALLQIGYVLGCVVRVHVGAISVGSRKKTRATSRWS
jgi:hypothetical protein